MFKRIVVFGMALVALLNSSNSFAQKSEARLSLQQAMQLMHNDNNSLKIASEQLKWAKTERQRLNAFWYPQISAAGAYMHTSNKIEVKESLSQFTDPAVEHIHALDPGEKIITSVLDRIGKASFSVPLIPRNTTSIDAVATLPIFTGGKRIYASKIGKLMIDMAQTNKERVGADQQVLLVETYYSLRLGQEIVAVRQETYYAMERHYQDALKLEANGLINKAERLYFQVNRDEAKRELQAAVKDLSVAQSAFKTLVKMEPSESVRPISTLFINESLPAIDYFKNLINNHNYLVNGIRIQHAIQNKELQIARSGYLPNIEVFGKQTLYSDGVPKNLLPRTMVGVGFAWNLFDGLDREKKISQAKINRYILDIQKDKLVEDLGLAVDKFYNQTQVALDNVTALHTTIEMSQELVRTRQRAFSEGMATSLEVIDAELILSKVRIAALLAYFEFDSGLINLLAVCGIPEAFQDYRLSGKGETNL